MSPDDIAADRSGLYLTIALLGLLGLALFGFIQARARAVQAADAQNAHLHSRPVYHGLFVVLVSLLPALGLLVVWHAVQPTIIDSAVFGGLPAEFQNVDESRRALLLNEIHNVAAGDTFGRVTDPSIIAAADRYNRMLGNGSLISLALALGLSVAGLSFYLRRVSVPFRARNRVEKIIGGILIACSTVAILTTVGIVMSLLFEAMRFFAKVPATEFLFGLEWSPQIALREDQVASQGLFGAVPIFAGTLMISMIAMLVAVPIGLLSAIYMSEYAPRLVRSIAKPMLEILAGVPTVVYGFFAALTVAPFLRDSGSQLGLSVSSESALAAGLVMGIMIIPFISSLSDDVINAVPQSMRDGSYGLGATKSETIRRVIVPAALPGIVGSILLAVSRAIGETMIVVMAAGLAANLTANPLESVTTVTVQIVTLLIGDQEFDSPKTLAAFALGLVLFCVTLLLNVVALHVVRKYREQYE